MLIVVVQLTYFIFVCTALTDSILNSVLSRGCRELQSLDVSSSPCQLSDYALHLISKCITPCCPEGPVFCIDRHVLQ